MRSEAIALGAVILICSHGVAYFGGRIAQAQDTAREAVAANIGATEVNSNIGAQVLHADGQVVQIHVNAQQEVADGRRAIETFTQPEAGRVGPDALVDRALARDVLCRIQRLRASANNGSAARDCAADQSERQP